MMVGKMTRKKPRSNLQKKEEEQTSAGPKSAYSQESGYKLYGYDDAQIPRLMREPFVFTKYRFPGLSAGQCVWSLFDLHNESVNIWTHLIGIVVFLIHVSKTVKTLSVLQEPFCHPLIFAILGSCTVLFVSVCAHLFNSISPYAYQICFFFDYASISFATFTFSQALFFYSRPLNASWQLFNSPETYLSLSLLNSCVCTFTCCAVLIKRPWYHIFVRSSAYLSLATFTALPYVGRLAFCTLHPSSNCVIDSAQHFKLVTLFFIAGGIIYAFRVPEYLVPRVFDLVGRSHNIFHVFSALGVVQFFTAIYDEMVQRKKELLSKPLAWAELSGIFCFLACFLNFGLVFWFSQKLYSRQPKKL